jgi:hypothetical protein
MSDLATNKTFRAVVTTTLWVLAVACGIYFGWNW